MKYSSSKIYILAAILLLIKTIYACELDTKQPETIEDRMSRKYGHEPFPVLTPAQVQEYGYNQNLADISNLFYFKPHLRQVYATYQFYNDTRYIPAFEDLKRLHGNSGKYLVDQVHLSLVWVSDDFDSQEIDESFIRIWCTYSLLYKRFEQEKCSALMEWRGRNIPCKG
jgi:hypothetical protein